VNLHTCWLFGQKQASELITDMEEILSTLSGIDMLSPFGNLLVNQQHESEDLGDEDDILDVSNQNIPEEGQPMPPSVPYTHEGDLEDVIADEVPRNKGMSEVFIQGKKTTKAKALRHRMADRATQSSTDRLKHVQQLPCFDSGNKITNTDIITTSNSMLGSPSLCIGNPVAFIVQCDGLIVLAIAQVNRL
jgi:hypothetical protein